MEAAKKDRKVRLTPRQKKLIALIPKVELGELSMMQAMKDAGYADSTAREQTQVLGGLGNNRAMQEALRKAGFTEEFIATKVMEGMAATEGITVRVGKDETDVVDTPDFKTRHSYLATGARLLDTFPTQRHQLEDLTPKTYGDIETPKAKTPAEAKALAEQEDN